MGFSVHWSWLIALSYLLCMGVEVRCNCTETNMQIEGGHYKLTKQLKAGSMLVYECPEGYYPYPAMTRLCLPNGIWRPPPKRFSLQRCRLVQCPDPSVLEYGNVSPPQEKYFVDNETTYECYSGYTMRGSSSRVCLPSGKWSGSTPICSRDSAGDHCADPGIPAGASRTGNMFGIDDTVRYSCNANLILVGSKERVCQENGQWSGSEPACYYKHTYDTSLEVSQEFGSAIKSSLTTLEPVGDIEAGRKIRLSKNGTLNIYIAVDISESIDERHINHSKEAITTLITKISSFNVDPNYEILFFNCEIYEVVNILDFWDSTVTLSSIRRVVEKFTVDDKTTIGSDLNLVFKTFLDRMAIIKRRVGEENFKEHRHVLIVFTDGAYNMGEPAPTVAKIKDIVYRDGTGELTQSREEHLDIYIFAIGEEIFDEDLKSLTAGEGGKHYFRMKDISNLHETFDDIIDEEDVKGLCGLHRDYDSGTKESKKKRHPWVAFIVVQKDGISRKCLGSLVSPDFVLTAAHCFSFGTIPEHVTVEIDDGQGRVKKVKMFKIHDRYDVTAKVQERVQQFYDYDVALIQLEKPVEISASARPICIPCTKETSQALRLGAASTCQQQERLLLNNHLESLSFLTRVSDFVGEKTVQAKLGDNRGECIRHALEAEGVDTDDPEVVVTENFLCTGGRSPQRDHIACKGDAGGAVFKNYEKRTIQVALVSWGTKNLCRSTSGLVESDDTSRDFHINLFKVIPFLKSVLGDDSKDYAPLEFLES